MAGKVLGAGRNEKKSPIDPSIGILLRKKVGDRVEKGEALAVFFSDGDENKIKPAKKKFLNAFKIGENRSKPPNLFHARITKDGVEKL